jgi:hypothetical protein
MISIEHETSLIHHRDGAEFAGRSLIEEEVLIAAEFEVGSTAH